MYKYSEIKDVDDSSKLFAYSVACIESAVELCGAVVTSNSLKSWANGLVVMYLWFHSFELFYKGALVSAGKRNVITHNICELREKYYELYRDDVYEVSDVFMIKKLPSGKGVQEYLECEEGKKYYDEMGQFYRYPFNNKGKPWAGYYGFEPDSCLSDLKSDRERLLEVIGLIENLYQKKI